MHGFKHSWLKLRFEDRTTIFSRLPLSISSLHFFFLDKLTNLISASAEPVGWRKQVACPETGQILLSARVTPPPSPFSHPPVSACLRPWSDRAQIWGYFSPHRARSHSHSTQQQTPAITGWNRHLKTAIIFVWVGSCGVSPLEIL